MTESATSRPAADGPIETCFREARGSSILVVVFSQVRVPAGHFGLSRLFARTRHACLFVNQPAGRWYRNSDDTVDAAVEEAVGRARPDRTILYGSSMGAWGALAAGQRHPAAEIVAFAPDFVVGEPSSRSAAAGLHPSPGERDLAARVAGRTAPTTIVAGLFDPYDAGVHARLLAAGPAASVRLLPVRSVHAVHDHLYTVNVIRRIIGGFDRDPAEAIASRGLLHPPVDAARLAGFAHLAARLQAGEAIDPAKVRALGLEDNPGSVLLEAEALAARGESGAAEAILAGLTGRLAASPVLSTLPKRWQKQVWRRRIALLDGLGRREAADVLAEEAARLFPTDAGFVVDR